MTHPRYRSFALALLATGSALMLAACQPAPPTPTAAPAKPAAPAPAPAPPSPVAAASPSPSPTVNPVTTGSEIVPAPAGATIKITAPTANATLPAGDVRVAYDIGAVTTVPAAEAKKVEDLHLHVLLDVDPATYLGTATFIPLGNPSILHTAAKEVAFQGLRAGQHRITVILTGANHVSVRPPVSDSVTFTVQ